MSGACDGAVDKSIYSDDHRRRLCRRLREMREAAGLSQTDLADRLGVSQSFVTKYERGDRRLDLFQLRAVTTALGVAVSELAREFDQPPSSAV